jgi:hypothetical protein
MINWWKKWIHFVKIKFQQMKILNDMVCITWIELNSNSNSNSSLQFRFDWIKIQLDSISIEEKWECKLVQKILKICSWQWCWADFHSFLLGNWLNKYQFGTIQIIDYGNCPKHNLLNIRSAKPISMNYWYWSRVIVQTIQKYCHTCDILFHPICVGPFHISPK